MIRDILEWYTEMGITVAVKSNKQTQQQSVNDNPTTKDPAITHQPQPSILSSTNTRPPLASTLIELRTELDKFNGCHLKFQATNTVFCDGNAHSPLMLIGEAPGADEDAQGKPFVGMSGQLLDKMFLSIGLKREDHYYITNIVPWRPPANRQPTQQEITMCLPFVEQHIALIKPKIIVTLGGVSTKAILQTQEGIMKLRGEWHEYTNPYLQEPILVMPMFHPAFLLRAPKNKTHTWQDLLKLKAYLIEKNLFPGLS